MESASKCAGSESFRYLDFAENQHLRALSNLCQYTDDVDQYARLLAHKAELEELIKRRRYLFEDTDNDRAAAYRIRIDLAPHDLPDEEE